ncbi:MAG TPA: serine/threonine-protein kinase [Burkholderiales bacterium]|jgi:CHASE2 domain-containing sensor protein|nr:serine/threonine-protein kinase [Burkholderiales bacterium]
MSKRAFWKADWFLGLLVVILVLFASSSDLLQSLERSAYDLGMRASERTPSDRIAVIAIDDQSIANIGRWPWPRDVHARMIERLAAAGVKVIGYASFFFEPQEDPGLRYLNRLIDLYQGFPPSTQAALADFGSLLMEAEDALNTDRKLALAIGRARNVVLPMLFQFGEPRGNPDRGLPEFVLNNQLSKVVDRVGATGANLYPIPSLAAAVPLEQLAAGAAALGHLNVAPDIDGSVRTEPLVVRYYDHYFPSLSTMLAAQSLNLGPQDIEVRLGEGVRLGGLTIATDPFLQMYTYFYKGVEGRGAFPVDSFYDVASGKIPAEKYRDKIVLIGATAAGVGSYQVTPVSPAMPPVMSLAHSVSSLLQEDFVVRPPWARWAELGAYALVALYIVLLLPRLGAGTGAAITATLFVALVGTHFALMTGPLMWLQAMSAVTLLVIGHLALVTKRFIVTERGKAKSDLESAESNRMLGLAFQGQGQLDLAFDKFRRVPLDDQLMDNLYNLALDFERKRQFNKAHAVYEHMAGYDPKFKDLGQKLARAKQMSETIVLGAAPSHPGGTLALAPGTEKPMLGRYQVERELGKGAMGVVYFGRDPKIGRTVAIKTLALSQEFDGEELEEVKRRFFREAETAGRLNHPNIVTIYDAGEEQDLAYIAMEFLKGRDLVAYTKSENLLPLPKVLSIVGRVAEALGYAHRQNVVHRDVKPANIMWDPDTDAVKVTDFGIARITDSSKTKTGIILGTPSYMSPEQLAGKKLDGQSDLFSLGVTLYQLVCGILPFQGETMTQLMFKIANEPPTDIVSVNPAIPRSLVAIIDKALAKDPNARFRTGEEMAEAIRQCARAAFGSVDLAL